MVGHGCPYMICTYGYVCLWMWLCVNPCLYNMYVSTYVYIGVNIHTPERSKPFQHFQTNKQCCWYPVIVAYHRLWRFVRAIMTLLVGFPVLPSFCCLQVHLGELTKFDEFRSWRGGQGSSSVLNRCHDTLLRLIIASRQGLQFIVGIILANRKDSFIR